MKYIAEIELDENRTTCIDCPLSDANDYCTLQDYDVLFINDGWDYQLSNCPLIKANEDLELAQAVREAKKRHAFKISFTSTNEKSGYKILKFRWLKDLINWHREQKESEDNE